MTTATFKPHKKQWEAWERLTDQTTSEIGYGGAASGGKSYLGCVWVTTMCKGYPGVSYLIGRKELTNLKRTTVETLFKAFSDFGIEPEEYTINWQNNVLKFNNGSQIIFLDLGHKPSDPLYTRLGGLELTGAFIDESNEISVQAINILKTRLGRKMNEEYNLAIKLFETFNPDKGHVYQRFYKPYKNGVLPEHVAFIPALATDNPYTSKAYIEQLEKSDQVTRERLLHGNFEYDDDPSLLVDTDAVSDLFSNTVDTTGKYIIADIARFGDDRTVISYWEGKACKEVNVYRKVSTDNSARLIREKSKEKGVQFSNILIDEDGIGGGVIDQLKGVKGFTANAAPISHDMWSDGRMKKHFENFNNMKSQCAFKLADMIMRREIAVHETNVEVVESLSQELFQLKRDNTNSEGKMKLITKDDMKKNIGRSPDILDVMIMRMWFEYKQPRLLGMPQGLSGIQVARWKE